MTIVKTKPRVVKDFEKLDNNVQQQIKIQYPEGFKEHLISFTNHEGKLVSAFPFETEDKHYLIRMTISQAQQIVEEDEDYDDDGILREDMRDEFDDDQVDNI